MACCDNHDRLDRLLHVFEYTGKTCGDDRLMLNLPTSEDVAVPPSDVARKPMYCCSECPTLIAKHRAVP